jgi:hypothetical protein
VVSSGNGELSIKEAHIHDNIDHVLQEPSDLLFRHIFPHHRSLAMHKIVTNISKAMSMSPLFFVIT